MQRQREGEKRNKDVSEETIDNIELSLLIMWFETAVDGGFWVIVTFYAENGPVAARMCKF